MKDYEHEWETAAVRFITDDKDLELLECPYCKEIGLPTEGGECEFCRMETYF